jgi:murein DD-endopeptidase MepM/ murein hydrolase activator NlpD
VRAAYTLPLRIPADAVVLDLSGPWIGPQPVWSIGRYDEDRGIYTQALFTAGRAPRTVHMGIDLGGPVGEPVYAAGDGLVIAAGALPAPGDYGHALVLEHILDGRLVYALYGHLAARSLAESPVGRRVETGDLIGWLGDLDENGGWPPHLHFQLAWQRPAGPDMPGAVCREERAAGLECYPDPRRMIGPVYR